jgi:hypothetical protein
MSKFLKLVQESTPGEEAGKGPFEIKIEDAQGNFMAKVSIPDSISSWFDNFLEFVTNTDGYDLEVEQALPVEDGEDSLKKKIENMTAIMNMPDQGILGQVMSPAARSAQMAKRNFAKGMKNMSKKFLDDSKS